MEEARRKRHLDFLDILLFARVSVCGSGLRLHPERHKKEQTLHSCCDFPRGRMRAACLTRTSVLRWTHSCSRAMTPQPVASLGSSMLWLRTPSISTGATRRSRASWGTATPSPGEHSRDGKALPTQLDKKPGSARLCLPSGWAAFISGISWIRCPTPPCASRRHCESILLYHLSAECSASQSPSLMAAPYPEV